jgi:RNA polymerase sigma factor (sigma-70 family)
VELLGVADICERIHRVEPDDSFVVHLHEIMVQSFSNVHFCAELFQMDPFETLDRINHTGDMEYWIPFFNEHVHEHPQFHLLLNPQTEIGATHQQTNHHEFLRTPLYNEFFVKVQSHNQMWLALPAGNQLLNCIYSREKPYSNNELAILRMIMPHVETAWRHWRQTRSLKEELTLLQQSSPTNEEQIATDQLLRKQIDTLPARQREVVERVSAGLDNQQIADAMGISKRTVQKHLELVFKALKVKHRTELAAQWHRANK